MKKIGFFGEAVATTDRGEVTLALATGLLTAKGKSLDPFLQGALLSSSAGGAGTVGSAEGDQVIFSGGTEGKLGCGGGVTVVVLLDVLIPQPTEIESAVATKQSQKVLEMELVWGGPGKTLIVVQTSISLGTAATSGGRKPGCN